MAHAFPISLLEPAHPPELDLAQVVPPANRIMDSVVVRAQAGDHDAFSELYGKHRRRVFSICLNMVRDFSLAEDLTQEAFLQLHRKLSTFRGDSAFTTWLHRLTFNIVLIHLRRRALPVVSLNHLITDTPDDPLGHDFGAPDLAQAGVVDRLDIDRALSALAPGYRNAFVLHDSRSLGNSKSQLYKARRAMRDTLSARRVSRTIKLETRS